MTTDRATIEGAYADLEAVCARIAGFDYTGLTVPELLDLLSRREILARRAPTVDHALLAAVQAQTTPREIGAKNWADGLGIRLHVSSAEAKRRVRDAANLGARRSLTGEPLPAAREHIAAAQAAGSIGAEHVAVMEKFFVSLPGWVDEATRAQCERTLIAEAGVGQSPEELSAATEALLFLLNQDGPEPDDAEKARKRAFSVGRQGADGMSKVSGYLTPEARAVWEAAHSKLGAPGMANPDDEQPCVSGTPSQSQIDADSRSPAQRSHDALVAMGRNVLASGELGEHNGLPVSVIVTTTLQDLEAGAGMAVTHTGTRMPIGDLIKLAAPAYHYLAVFDRHTNVPLYLGRARRTATAGQRLVLFARDRGCTRPGCTAPASRSQAHHADADWQHHGPPTSPTSRWPAAPTTAWPPTVDGTPHDQRPRPLAPTTAARYRPTPHQPLPPPPALPRQRRQQRRRN